MPFPLKEARFDCRVCPSIPWTPATCKANKPKRDDNSRAIQQATETRSTKTRILSFLSWLGLSYLSSEMSLSRSCRRSVSKLSNFPVHVGPDRFSMCAFSTSKRWSAFTESDCINASWKGCTKAMAIIKLDFTASSSIMASLLWSLAIITSGKA